jgi:hypothetical protein
MFGIERIFSLVRSRKSPYFHWVDSRNYPAADERMTDMITKGTENFSPVYSAWFGKPVVLLVVIRQCRVPMPCSIVAESPTDVRVRFRPGWEMDVRKELILALEEDTAGLDTRVN